MLPRYNHDRDRTFFFFSYEGERRIEFRGEFFNLLNTPQFNNPNAAIGAQQAGIISAAGSKATFLRTSRQIQMALKALF